MGKDCFCSPACSDRGLHVPTTISEESLLVFRPSSYLAAALLCKRMEQVQKVISVHLSNLAL